MVLLCQPEPTKTPSLDFPSVQLLSNCSTFFRAKFLEIVPYVRHLYLLISYSFFNPCHVDSVSTTLLNMLSPRLPCDLSWWKQGLKLSVLFSAFGHSLFCLMWLSWFFFHLSSHSFQSSSQLLSLSQILQWWLLFFSLYTLMPDWPQSNFNYNL